MVTSPYILVANRFEPTIRRVLIAAWNQLRTQESRAAIETALRTGGIDAVLRLYETINPAITAALNPVLDDTLRAGSDLALQLIPSSAIVVQTPSVSLFNRNTVSFLENYKLNLINQISSNTREAVRQSLISDSLAGVNPRQTAINFRNTLGLTPSQEQSVRNYRGYLQNLDRQALARELRDKRSDRLIRRAIDNNQPLPESTVNRLTNRYRERYIRHRSEVIARTEALRATSIGNRAAIDNLLAQGDIDVNIVRRFWLTANDDRVRNSHSQIPGLNQEGRRLDEPFTTPLGPLMFPRDPNGLPANTIQCRCVEFYRLQEAA